MPFICIEPLFQIRKLTSVQRSTDYQSQLDIKLRGAGLIPYRTSRVKTSILYMYHIYEAVSALHSSNSPNMVTLDKLPKVKMSTKNCYQYFEG